MIQYWSKICQFCLFIICTCSPLENLTLDVRFDRSIICSSDEEDAILDLVYSIKVQIVWHSSSFDDFSIHSHPVLWSFKKVARFDFLNIWQIAFHLSRHDHFFRVISCVSNILTFTGKILLSTILFLVCHKCRGVEIWESSGPGNSEIRRKREWRVKTVSNFLHQLNPI